MVGLQELFAQMGYDLFLSIAAIRSFVMMTMMVITMIMMTMMMMMGTMVMTRMMMDKPCGVDNSCSR